MEKNKYSLSQQKDSHNKPKYDNIPDLSYVSLCKIV